MALHDNTPLAELVGVMHGLAVGERTGALGPIDREDARRRNLGVYSLTSRQLADERVDLRPPATSAAPEPPGEDEPSFGQQRRRRRSLLGG